MASWYFFNFSIQGTSSQLDEFLNNEIDQVSSFEIKENFRIMVEDTDRMLIGEDVEEISITGQQAWDEGSEWLKLMHQRYPNLTFHGEIQSWEQVEL